MKKHLLYLFLLLFTACYRTEPPANVVPPSLTGTWMGGAYELDRDVYTPFPKILHFSADSTYQERWPDKPKIDTFQWAFQNDTLRVDTFFFPREEIKVGAEELRWAERYTRIYRRLEEPTAAGLDSTKINQLLLASCWKSKEEKLLFQADGQLWATAKNEENYQTYCYTILNFGPYFFLVKYGNQVACPGTLQYLEQIISLDAKELKVLRWEKDGFQEVSYLATAFDQKAFTQPASFQLCNKYLYINIPLYHRYNFEGTRYPGGLYQINKVFKEKYKAPRNAKGQTGLIRMRFVVNCVGQAGLFEQLELDRNYQERKFDRSISSQIREICSNLQSWIPGVNNEEEKIDSYKYLTFKIKDGKIIEIF